MTNVPIEWYKESTKIIELYQKEIQELRKENEELKKLVKNNGVLPVVVGSDNWKADLHKKTQNIKNPKKTTRVRL